MLFSKSALTALVVSVGVTFANVDVNVQQDGSDVLLQVGGGLDLTGYEKIDFPGSYEGLIEMLILHLAIL